MKFTTIKDAKPARRPFNFATDLTQGGRAPPNTSFGPTVSYVSAETRTYHASLGNADRVESRGSNASEPVNPDSPITHHNNTAIDHRETVGHDPVTGKHTPATHPNAQAKAAGNLTRTHAPLKTKGLTRQKTGGSQGELSVPPRKKTSEPADRLHPEQLGGFNHARDRAPAKLEQQPRRRKG